VAKLPFVQKLVFGVGDFGGNLFWATTNLFLLYYYTDVLKIAPVIAGAIYLVSLIWDAVTDPVMGLIASRTRTRFGRYRPYLLWGAVPAGMAYALLFVPLPPGSTAAVVGALFFHLLFRTAHTVVAVPYGSLMAALTDDARERSALAASRMIFATLGALLVAAGTLPLVEHLGSGDRARGFFIVGLVYAALGSMFFLITGLFTREREMAPEDIVPFSSAWRLLVRNRPFLILAAGILAFSIGSTMATKVLVYVFKYRYEAPDMVSAGLGVYILMVSVFTLVWMFVARRYTKRVAWLGGAVGYAAVWAVIVIHPPATSAGLVVALAFAGAFAAALPVTFWAMVPDTVEYSELRSGQRADGYWFGMVALAQKIALGVGVGLVGLGLDVSGYVAEVSQSAGTLDSLDLLMAVPPVLMALVSAVIIVNYPIDHVYHSRLKRLIARRGSRR